jgi:hypothetical protein
MKVENNAVKELQQVSLILLEIQTKNEDVSR